jgi:TolB protein
MLLPRAVHSLVACLAVAAAALAAACSEGGGQPVSTEPAPHAGEPSGALAFVSFRQGDQEVFIKDLPDGAERNLTNDPSDDFDPDITSDGERIAFVSNRSGVPEIYTTDSDGAGLRQLTDGGPAAQTPRWSSDGARIAFSLGGAVAVISADGGDITTLLEPDRGSDPRPCLAGAFIGGWSPDDSEIVFYSAYAPSNEGQVCTLSVSGGEPAVLIAGPGEVAAEPVYSPDGTAVVYRAIVDGQHDIWLLDVASGNRRNLTDDPDLDIEPEWSPDGQWIAYGSLRPGEPFFDLFVMRPDGGDVRRITDDPSKEANPVWGESP